MRRLLGFPFAILYSLWATLLILAAFGRQPSPWFTDVYAIGVLFTASVFSSGAALFQLLISLLAGAYILPPFGSLVVDDPVSRFGLISYSLVGIWLIWTVRRVQARSAVEELRRLLRAVYGRSM